MKRLLALLFGCFCLSLPVFAQSNKLIRELESKRSTLQKQIAESETLLQATKKNVGSRLSGLASLTGQIEERKRYILTINHDLEAIDREVASLGRQIAALQRSLKDRRDKYAASVQYLYKNRSIEEKLMFIFSAKTLAQTYRRLRYVREYATFQRLQGEEILKKQQELDNKKAELLEVRAAKEKLLEEREDETAKLEAQEKQQRSLVNSLRRQQRSLQNELDKKRREANRLNDRIDRLIAEEIEKARRRAEEEARRRGKLPVPITGPYLITSHFGQYTVEGLRNVKLDNKGIDIQGQPGAQARAILGGKVAAVFQLNGLFNILVRHGAYISVYCNLSSASVKTGDTVTIRQPLGTVFSNPADGGRTVLHFQLRKEKQKLNPEPWLSR